MGLSAAQCRLAEADLDWLLGWHLTGEEPTAGGTDVEWVRLQMY